MHMHISWFSEPSLRIFHLCIFFSSFYLSNTIKSIEHSSHEMKLLLPPTFLMTIHSSKRLAFVALVAPHHNSSVLIITSSFSIRRSEDTHTRATHQQSRQTIALFSKCHPPSPADPFLPSYRNQCARYYFTSPLHHTTTDGYRATLRRNFPSTRSESIELERLEFRKVIFRGSRTRSNRFCSEEELKAKTDLT